MAPLECDSADGLRVGGFHYDKTWDRYVSVREAIWEVGRRVERGGRRLVAPARTRQECIVEEEHLVTRLMKRLRARTGSAGMDDTPKLAEVDPKTDKRVKVCKLFEEPDKNDKCKPEVFKAKSSTSAPGSEAPASAPEGKAGDDVETLFNPVREEVNMLQAQATKLRAAIARRRANPGLSNQTDDVPAIISHYETVLAELETRIARLGGHVDRAAPAAGP